MNLAPKVLFLCQNSAMAGAAVRSLLKNGASATHVKTIKQAVKQLEERPISLLLVDMPEGRVSNGGEWTRLAQEVTVPTVVLAPIASRRPAWPRGPAAFVELSKPVSWERVLRVVADLLEGRGSNGRPGVRPLNTEVGRKGLSRRKTQVLGLVVEGRPNKSIAAEMGISEPTVKKHVHRIIGKLNARDRVQAAVIAVREGLVGEAA